MQKKTVTTIILMAMALCALLLTSCNKEPKTDDYDTALREYMPTRDALINQLTTPAIFLGSDSSKESIALQRRLTNVATSLSGNQLQTVIIPADMLASLDQETYVQLRDLVTRGGNVVVLSPNESSIGKLAQILGRTVDIPMLPPKGQPLSVMGVKQGKTYFSFKSSTEESASEYSEYFLGLKADALVSWLNKPAEPSRFKDDLDEEPSEVALENLVAPQEITFDLGTQVRMLRSNGKWWETNHDITLIYRIWKAHSFDKNLDYYCIKEEITAYNNYLKCGPEKEDSFDEISKSWEPWEKAMADYGKGGGFGIPLVYGPYMHHINISNKMSSDTQTSTIVAYDPENSTSGGATVTESFSCSLGGNMGASMSGPSAMVSMGLSWGTSVAKFSPDLAATANLEKDGLVKWTYKGARPGTHYHFWSAHTHDLAASILKNTCTLHQAWVWSVPSTGPGSVTVEGNFESGVEWLTYDVHNFETFEIYVKENNARIWGFTLDTPPQYKQEWSMTISPYNAAVEDYLISHLGSDYYWSKSTFFTEKEQHTAADTDDEISAYVATSKAMFDNNPNVMKQAAEAGGITSGGYTILWQNLTGPDDANFSYEVNL